MCRFRLVRSRVRRDKLETGQERNHHPSRHDGCRSPDPLLLARRSRPGGRACPGSGPLGPASSTDPGLLILVVAIAEHRPTPLRGPMAIPADARRGRSVPAADMALGDGLMVMERDQSSPKRCAGNDGRFPERPLTVFHACGTPLSGLTAGPRSWRREHRQSVEREFESSIERMDEHENRQPPSLVMEDGLPRTLLKTHARDMGVDLVVLGVRERSTVLETVVGNLAETIMDEVPCDVLVVRNPPTADRRSGMGFTSGARRRRQGQAASIPNGFRDPPPQRY